MKAALLLFLFAACLAVVLVPGASAQEVTTVRITDNVLVEDTLRLGINTGGDNYWDSSITKIRAAENFEGVMYRMISWGPEQRADGIAVWFSPPREAWDAMKGKVKWTLLGGPAKGEIGLIKDITTTKIRDGREITYIVFDHEVPPSDMNKNGILLEYDNPTQGSIRESNNKAFWNTAGNDAHIGDVPEGSYGQAALWLKGEKPGERAHYAFVPMWGNQAPQDGTWRIQLWAKAKAGDPKFVVEVDGGRNVPVELTGEWVEHDLSVEVEGLDAEGGNVTIRLAAAGGEVLVDDVVIWKEEESRNPTAFRDPLVDVIKKLNPGILRILQMGGSDLSNNLKPPLQQMQWSRNFNDLVSGGRNGANQYKFNLHDYYGLCEYVGARPWYCLPGTIHPEEMEMLMQYLAAPADVGYGKVRAQLGHPEPWTETFDVIYIEFGNEAWNPGGYATGSFNGPDHWHDLIEAGKASDYFRENIKWVAGSQAGSTGVTASVLRDVPNADAYAIAPYMMNGIKKSDMAHLQTDDELFRWVFAYAIRRVREPVGNVFKHYQMTSAADKELAIYEHQFHLTNPMPNQNDAVPLELRKRFMNTLGGGINIINDSLHMLRREHIRAQCLFNLSQRGFMQGVPLWGFVPGLNYKDQRYRPQFLAQEIVNDVIGGDMVETVHSGAQPTFSATGVFEDNRRSREHATYEDIPTIWTYAFSDGDRRALVLFNLDTSNPQTVKLEFAGGVAGNAARGYLLSADEIWANNEPDTEAPMVEIHEEAVRGFASGHTVALPAHSMMALEWMTE